MSQKHYRPLKGIIHFLSNPIVGFIGVLASVCGIMTAIYLYYQSREVPQLEYLTNPVKAIIVKVGQASRLTVLYDNSRIDSDITAAQLAIWNAGKKGIKPENILEPIVISTPKGQAILEASVRKVTRQVVGLKLNLNSLREGRLPVSWRILEQGDGAVIQVIYAGGFDVQLKVSGTVEGQGEPMQFHPSLVNIREGHPFGFLGEKISGWGGLALGIMVIIMLIFRRKMMQIHTLPKRFAFIEKTMDKVFLNRWMLIIIAIIYLVPSIYILVIWVPPGPPFGF